MIPAISQSFNHLIGDDEINIRKTLSVCLEINEPLFDHLFISKKEAKEQGVYHLGVNDLITVYGIVNSAYNKEPWIEVYVIKKGWE